MCACVCVGGGRGGGSAGPTSTSPKFDLSFFSYFSTKLNFAGHSLSLMPSAGQL